MSAGKVETAAIIRERHRRSKRSASLANGIAFASAIFASTIFLVGELGKDSSGLGFNSNSKHLASLDGKVAALDQRIAAVKADQERLRKSFLSNSGSVEARMMDAKIREIELRQLQIERVIMTNPAKALETPMIRRDIDALRETNAQAITNVQQDIDQIYDLTKWLLGTLVVGLASLALSNYFSRKP